MQGIFRRTQLLVGDVVMNTINATKVIIFGVGGVGSWCAESLVRSGIIHLTIVDSDRVCVTNVNRQLMATSQTVGQVKTEALKKRLLEINPLAQITEIQDIYQKSNCHTFHLQTYDYIIDAIDSLEHKVHLIQSATQTNAVFFSSMGAALKMDASRIKVAEFWKVQGCPLAAALRRKLKKTQLPAKKFLCVYSDELLENKGENLSCGTSACLCPKSTVGPGKSELLNHEWCTSKAQINGTMAHITAIFGFMLAGLLLEDIYKKTV